MQVTYSIIIPTCNRPHYLIDAVLSAANAGISHAEIIVVNDGDPLTPDALPDVAIPLKIIPNTNPSGASGARNTGVRHAVGDWILFLDDDDLIVPGYWDALIKNKLVNLPQDTLVFGFCDTQPFQDRAHTTPPVLSAFTIDEHIAPHDPSSLSGLGKGFWTSRYAYEKVGGLDTAIRVNEDTEFCLRLLSQGARVFQSHTTGVLIFQGPHANAQPSVTATSSAASRRDDIARIIAKHQDYLSHTPAMLIWLHHRLYKFAARAGALQPPQTGGAFASLPRWDRIKLGSTFYGYVVLTKISRKNRKAQQA